MGISGLRGALTLISTRASGLTSFPRLSAQTCFPHLKTLIKLIYMRLLRDGAKLCGKVDLK